MKRVANIITLFFVLFLVGCSPEQTSQLLGTWRTELIPSEWGTNQITVTYFPDGRLAGTNDFPGEGSLQWEGTFQLRNEVIERTVEGRTVEIPYRIEGDIMYQKIGDEDYSFRRVVSESSERSNGN